MLLLRLVHLLKGGRTRTVHRQKCFLRRENNNMMSEYSFSNESNGMAGYLVIFYGSV